MFDVGFSEMLLVALVALLVLGPERLPGAARTAGRLIGKLKRSWSDVRDEIDRELQAEDLKKRVNEAVMQGRDAADGFGAEARQHIDAIVRQANSLTTEQGRKADPSAGPEEARRDDA